MKETKDNRLKVRYRRNDKDGIDIWIYRGNKHVATVSVDQDDNVMSFQAKDQTKDQAK